MKQKLLSFRALLLVLLVTLSASTAWAETYTVTPDQTTTGSTATGYVTSLTSFTSNGVSWSINQWNPSNLQIKTNQSSAASEFRFYNTSAFSGKITKVVITFSALTLKSTETTGMMFVGGSSEVTTTTGGTNGVWDNSAKTLTWEPSATDNFTYFAFFQNGKVATGVNKLATTNAIVVTYEAGASTSASAPTLTTAGIFTTSTYDVTITNKESGATVYYTTDGTDPTTSSSSFTGDSKTLTIDATTTVKAMAVISGKDNSSIASATYTYEKSIANTLETAYTTAEATDIIDGNSTQLTTTQVYVKGTVSKVDSYNSTYGSLTYWLDNDAFEVYSGLNNNGEKFSSVSDVQVGAEVVVYGIIKKYGTTYEFDKNNWLVQYTAPAKSAQTITFGTYNTSLTTADAADSFTAETNGDGTLSVESSNTAVATATISEGTVTVTPVAAGTTTITVSAAATDTWNAGTKSYTLTVSAPALPAALPFSYEGNETTLPQGVTKTGVAGYSAAPYLKFDGTGDELVINYGADAGKLSYTIKGNGTSWTGQFDVMESADGTDYTSVKSYTELAATATTETATLNAASRYVKFVFTNKTSGNNVALGAISIKAAGAKEDAQLAFEKDSYTFATTASSMAVKATSAAGSTGAVTYALTDGDANNFLIDENTGVIVCETAGTYTVTATIAENDTYASATATATVTLVAPQTADVALVVKYGDKYYAMDVDFDAVEVQIKDNKAYVAAPLKENITWTASTLGTVTTFQAFDDEYLSAPSKTSLTLVSDPFNWTYDKENKTWSATVGTTERTFLYREQAAEFRAYTTTSAGTDDYSNLAQAYEIATYEVGAQDAEAGATAWTTSSYSTSVPAGKYGTICLPYAATVEGAAVYKMAGKDMDGTNVKSVTFELTENTASESVYLYAGTPYLFKATAATQTFTKAGENANAVTPVMNVEGFTGTYAAFTLPANAGYYFLTNASNANQEFALAGDNISVGAFKCYISTFDAIQETPEAGDNAPRRVTLGGEMEETPTGIDALNVVDYGTNGKYLLNGQLVIIREGHMYNAAGQLMK